MPLSKKRMRERKRADRAAKKAQGTVVLSKALIRRLRASGIDPSRYLTVLPVSLGEYQDLQKRVALQDQRIDWQKGGSQRLLQEIAYWKAIVETQASVLGKPGIAALQTRLLQLEADNALHEATAHSKAGGLLYDPAEEEDDSGD